MESVFFHNRIYCYSCMEELREEAEICPFCGKSTKGIIKNERILPPGTVLQDKYLLGTSIGEGGFGITYKGIDLNLRLKVAVKEYFPSSFATRDVNTGGNAIQVIGGKTADYYQKGLNDYAKEANRLSQFANLQGVVSVLNFFYENNSAYMVMEYIEGITLNEYLSAHKGKLGWKETLNLMHPIILSLGKIHQMGIIHRDISPDNIMMNEHREMVLIDFGAARNVDHTQKKTVVLKQGYAPLEQYQANGNQGTWTDVYGVCATIYRMIKGERLPDALAVASGNAKIVSLKASGLPVPPQIDKVILRGLEAEIKNRIQTMEELELCLYRDKKLAHKPGKRIKVIVSAICVFAAASVLILGWRWLGEKDSAERETANTESDAESEQNLRDTPDETEEKRGSLPAEDENESDDSGEAAEEDEAKAYYESLASTEESAFTWEEKDGGVVITGADYTLSEIVVPATINGMPVYEVQGLNPNVVSVVLQNGVQIIAANAFKNCVYLESLYIPESVAEIGNGALENCLVLSDIEVAGSNQEYYSENGHLYTKNGEMVY